MFWQSLKELKRGTAVVFAECVMFICILYLIINWLMYIDSDKASHISHHPNEHHMLSLILIETISKRFACGCCAEINLFRSFEKFVSPITVRVSI